VTEPGHICHHPEVLIEEANEDDVLKAGMLVLVPCPVCGATPLESMEINERHTAELQAALIAQRPNTPLYHWSPRARRKQILRYGLRPGMRPTTTAEFKAPYVCFADTPSWAWVLSGDMPYTPAGEWDLWQTWLEALDKFTVLASPDRPSGIHEVRVEQRVYKRDLWWVGSRVCDVPR
jgi:hypothetical protein